jgi:hypothetical protein
MGGLYTRLALRGAYVTSAADGNAAQKEEFMKKIFAAALAFIVSAGLSAQTAESDFTVADNGDGTVTITKYEGWDSKVTIPAAIGGRAVTVIGKGAFAKQADLTSVTIPDSVISIGESAFATNKLTSVTFGKSVIVIGNNAFYDNSLTSVTLPASVIAIGERAFSHNLLAKITIPGFNTFIGKYAFARNKQLTSVTLGSFFTFSDIETPFIEEDNESWSREWATNDIGERGKNLFWDYVCNDRKAGTYTPDLKYRAVKKDGDFEYVATKYGVALTGYNGTAASIPIPEKAGGLAVKYLHSGTFENKTVERVRIPNTVTSIGARVFSNKNLTSVTIPDSVTYIGSEAFRGNQLASVTIPDGVTEIGSGAFRDNQLTSVTIPDGVTEIWNGAFRGNQLTSVTIPDGVTYIGDYAFSENRLTSVTIPDGVTSIGESAFYGNELTSVVIGANVRLEDRSFDYSRLESFYNSNGKKAGEYTYSNRSWSFTPREESRTVSDS